MRLANWIYLSFIFLANLLAGISVYYISDNYWWFYWVATFIPLFLLFLVLLLILSFFRRNRIITYFNFISILFILYIIRQLWIPIFNPKNKNYQNEAFSVMNYNVSFFYLKADSKEDYYDPLQNHLSVEMINWLDQQPVDIIALQEFYNDSTSTIFNVIGRLEKAGFNNHYFTRVDRPRRRGLMIFSRWPILDQKKIFLSENSYNGAQSVDIKYKNDTIRIINLHLSSSQLGYMPGRLKSSSFFDQLKWKLTSLKRTTKERIEQSNLVYTFASQSPLPVILIGDFNTPVYSGILKKFFRSFKNAHFQAGQGLGFTYFINNFWAVDIDHQFYSGNLNADKFIILRDVKYSEHRPVIGFYHLQN